MTEIVVPALGESVTEATVAKWLKQPGETVAVDEPVVELETDKVSLEVNATAAGTLSEIRVDEGATVEVGARRKLEGERVVCEAGRRGLGEEARDRDRALTDGVDDPPVPRLGDLLELDMRSARRVIWPRLVDLERLRRLGGRSRRRVRRGVRRTRLEQFHAMCERLAREIRCRPRHLHERDLER